MLGDLLSICMIVRDEEEVLERCLESVVELADEIVVVDTGSIDKTKEIAEEFTDKVYDFKWVDDFSAARNFAASKAKGNWIFVIDADEYIEKSEFNNFRNYLKDVSDDINVLGLQIVSFTGRGGFQTALNYHERVYRNNGLIQYERPIHESLIHSENKKRISKADFKLYHSGYMENKMDDKVKTRRNLDILLAIKDKQAIDYFYIGNEYSSSGDIKRAIEFYEKAHNLNKDPNRTWLPKLYIYLINSYIKNKQNNKALDLAKACEQRYPNTADFKYFIGEIYMATDNYSLAEKSFKEIIENRTTLTANHSLEFLDLLPHVHLAEIYEKEGELHKAVEYYSKAISMTDSNGYLWSRLLYLLGKNSSLEELVEFINNKVVNSSGMSEIKMIHILLSVPLLDVQKLSRSLLDNDKLTEEQNTALLVKNLFLDCDFEEVNKMLAEMTISQVIDLLKLRIFNIKDLIIFKLSIDKPVEKEIFSKHKELQISLNLLEVMFESKVRSFNEKEGEQFVKIYEQAQLLKLEEVTSLLYEKYHLLDEKSREKIKLIDSD